MKLYFNKQSKILSLIPGGQTNVGSLSLKRYTTAKFELIPTNAAGAIEPFGNTAQGVCVVKKKLDYTGASKLLDAAWTPPVTQGQGYRFAFLVAGPDLDAEILTKPSVTLALEFAWEDAGERDATPSIDFIVGNNYWREDDPPADPATPMPMPGNIITIGTSYNGARITADGIEIQDPETLLWSRLGQSGGQITLTPLP